MYTALVRERICIFPHVVASVVGRMADPLWRHFCWSLAGLSMELSGKIGGAGGIIDCPSEYIVDVRLGVRAMCAEDHEKGTGTAQGILTCVVLRAPLWAS